MKHPQKTLLTAVAIITIFPILIGLIGCVISTSAKTLIWVGKKLQPIEHQLESAQECSAISIAGGVIVFWSCSTLIEYLNTREVIRESDTPANNSSRYLGISKESPQVPSTCQKCRNYHGRFYGENMLICAIHPYGWTDENCPDYIGKS